MDSENIKEYGALLSLGDLVRPMAIRAAVTFGVMDCIAKNDFASIDLLADNAKIGARYIRSLVKVLEEMNLVYQNSVDNYCLTPTGQRLTNAHPAMVSTFDLRSATGQYEYSVVDLISTLEVSSSYFKSRFGVDYWKFVEKNSADLSLIAALSASEAGFDAMLLYDDLLWLDILSVIDLGGGNGNIAVGLANRYEHLSISVFDLPGRTESAANLIADNSLNNRIQVIGGDFFEPLPAVFDCYLLNAILADWSNSSCMNLLSNIASAMSDSSVLLISEVDPSSAIGSESIHLKMICAAEGWIRTEDEIEQLALNSGFKLIRKFKQTDVRFTHMYKLSDSFV